MCAAHKWANITGSENFCPAMQGIEHFLMNIHSYRSRVQFTRTRTTGGE